MADIPVLACTGGALQGERFRVPDERSLKVGRADDNDIVVLDDGVSRYHAEFLYENGSLWLRDLGSRNGVFVNGIRVTSHQQLKVGDEIAIADHTFAVRWNEPDQEEEPATEEMGDGRGGRRRWFWPFSK